MPTTRNKIIQLVRRSVKSAGLTGKNKNWRVEVPNNPEHGDYSTNVSLVLTEEDSGSPMELGRNIKKEIEKQQPDFIKEVELVEPGFLNFTLAPHYLYQQLQNILQQQEQFGQVDIGQDQKVQIEFISANPTGPLTLGNGRGGFLGDVLANILIKANFNVRKEYYINDAGNQITKLGHSVLKDEQAVYEGDYIDEMHDQLGPGDPQQIGQQAASYILENFILPTLKQLNIEYDNFFSEAALDESGEVDEIIKRLKQEGFTYEKEGALWLRTTNFGDDKDRVLVTSEGEKTYLVTDIAYHIDKFRERNFDKVINIWGADHQGHVTPLKAGLGALGIDVDKLDIIIVQMVRVLSQGQEVKMSKRAGTYRTLKQLVDEVGLDVARYFFIDRNPDSHLDFDLDLAKKESTDNPVYYIQYAHTRISSIFRNLEQKETLGKIQPAKFSLLQEESELNLIKQLLRYPEVITDISQDYRVQQLPQFTYKLAQLVHQFYRDCRVLEAKEELQQARLGLLLAVQIVLRDALSLIGVSAPTKM